MMTRDEYDRVTAWRAEQGMAPLPSFEDMLAESEAFANQPDRRAEVAALVEDATALRDTLAYVVTSVPVSQRSNAQVEYLTALGTALTVQTLGATDPELERLRGECSALALAATQQRLAAVFGPQP